VNDDDREYYLLSSLSSFFFKRTSILFLTSLLLENIFRFFSKNIGDNLGVVSRRVRPKKPFHNHILCILKSSQAHGQLIVTFDVGCYHRQQHPLTKLGLRYLPSPPSLEVRSQKIAIAPLIDHQYARWVLILN